MTSVSDDRDSWALRHFGNYVEAFHLATLERYGTDWKPAVYQAAAAKWAGRGAHVTPAQSARVRRLLGIGWYSAHQLRWPDDHPDILEFANQWTVVQSYYAAYSSAQAAKIVTSGTEASSHGSFLAEMSRAVVSGHAIYPLTVCSESVTPETVRGLRGNFTRQPGFRPARLPDTTNYEQYLWTAVTATRRRALDDEAARWRAKNSRPRYPAGRRRADDRDAKRFHPTTLFDLLYQMRRRANYGDSEVFVADGIGHLDHARLLAGLVTIVDFAQLVSEATIAACGGGPLLGDALSACRLSPKDSPRLYERAALWAS